MLDDEAPGRTTFQPTLPARGATKQAEKTNGWEKISTHAPRTGSDYLSLKTIDLTGDFNPRSPHGERPVVHFARMTQSVFQPTLPARGATRHERRRRPTRTLFQPTLPARGATRWRRGLMMVCGYFNPRSPHGERQSRRCWTNSTKPPFQPTLPARGATGPPGRTTALRSDFNPRSPHGERPARPASPAM